MSLPPGIFFTDILKPSKLSIVMSITYRQPPLPALCTLVDRRAKEPVLRRVAVPLHQLVQLLPNSGDRI